MQRLIYIPASWESCGSIRSILIATKSILIQYRHETGLIGSSTT